MWLRICITIKKLGQNPSTQRAGSNCWDKSFGIGGEVKREYILNEGYLVEMKKDGDILIFVKPNLEEKIW